MITSFLLQYHRLQCPPSQGLQRSKTWQCCRSSCKDLRSLPMLTVLLYRSTLGLRGVQKPSKPSVEMIDLNVLGAKLMRGGWNKSIEDLHMLQGYERDGCESNLNVLSELWAGWEMIWSKVQMTVGNSAWQRCLQSGVKYHAHEKLQLHTSANIITYYHILTCLHKHSRTL